MRLPFLAVAAMSAVGAAAAIWLTLPPPQTRREPVPILSVLRVPAVGACAAAVIVAAATMSMLEPVLALHLQLLGINPGAHRTGVRHRRRRLDRRCTRSTDDSRIAGARAG